MLHRGRERSILQNILVADVMRREVHTVRESTFLADIIRAFQEYNTSYLEMVDENGELSGIISFRDIRLVLQEPQMGYLVVAKEVATTHVVTVNPTDDADKALRKMGQTGVSQLPVVDGVNTRKVIGILHEKDITAAYDRESLARKIGE